MRRKLYTQLLKWKESPRRKPLMIYGARQVGKTYLVNEFGNNEFEAVVYVNCYQNPAVVNLFAEDKNIERIILGLSAISGHTITPGKTLLFLDEVQEIPKVIAALKYFCEDVPELHVVVAGSLLGVVNMADTPFPTGKVEILHLYPLDFEEFLDAIGQSQALDVLRDKSMHSMVNALLPQYTEWLRQYYFVGGMPEAVVEFINTKDPGVVRRVQQNILMAYEADIAKHAGADTQRARMVFQAIPSQLARANRKFIFGVLKKGSRAADYDTAIQWLVDAGLVYKVCNLTKVAIPLNFYIERNTFKLFLLDVGLLGAMSQAPADQMLIGSNVFSEFKGAFTENYVLTQLKVAECDTVAYYSKENSTLEIDFVAQVGSTLLPIEVKAEVNVKSKSMRQFITVDNAGSGLHGYRFSMLGYDTQDWLTNVPLPAVGSFITHLSFPE